eukprot:11169314-Lingulodinium_polyedra.AAC.1
MSCHVMPRRVTSRNVRPCHAMARPARSLDRGMSCHATSCHATSCYAMLNHAMDATPRRAMSCR